MQPPNPLFWCSNGAQPPISTEGAEQMKRELKIFDKPKNVKIFLGVFYVSLAALLVLDFFIHQHGEFPWENAPDFFAVYGFISCVLLIFIAKALRIIIKRNENYYE